MAKCSTLIQQMFLIQDQLAFQNDVISNLRKLRMKTGHESAIFVPDDCAKSHS